MQDSYYENAPLAPKTGGLNCFSSILFYLNFTVNDYWSSYWFNV